MGKILNLEYSASHIVFDPSRLEEDDPDRSKIEKAIQLLKRAAKGRKEAEKLVSDAVSVLYPLELEIEAASTAHLTVPESVELTEDNSDITLESVDGQLGMSYSVRFSIPIGDDFTDEKYEQWEAKGGFQYLGLTFAKDAAESDDGRAALSWSVEEE